MMHRIFVLRVNADCGSVETLSGRVEHVFSGESRRFENVSELLTFVGEALEAEKLFDAQERDASDTLLS
jgi:hypothetical protein